MSRLDQVYKHLDSLVEFLQPALPFVNSHLVDYATKSHWENYIPEKLRQDLEGQSIQNLQLHICNLAHGSWTTYEGANENNDSNFNNVESLSELIVCIGQHLISSSEISIKPEEVQIQGVPLHSKILHENFHNVELKFDPIMSAKKKHEVESLSEFIFKIANSLHGVGDSSFSDSIEYLVDVGSGKGYLSSYLALLYQFRVLAIDSSSINTQGCEKRSANLQRLWSQLLRRAIEKQTLGEVTRRGKRWRARLAKEAKQLGNNNILGIAEECKETTSDNINIFLENETMFVTENTDLADVLRSKFLPTSSSHTDFGLIGLHTCGNLGVDSLKLFIANAKARFMVNVPCCYYLLDETSHCRSGSSVFWDSDLGALDSGGITFPISKFLLDKKSSLKNPFSLGRNARMMSSYSLHRMSSDEKELNFPQSMLYRVLLQILINEKLGHTLLEYNVGKIGEKCACFNEYVRKALVKLHLENVLQVTDTEVDELYQSFDEGKRNQLHMYFLLRSIFAPLVEGCILLDRLAFLLEQECVKEADIIELFDPFTSPRCHAILATK